MKLKQAVLAFLVLGSVLTGLALPAAAAAQPNITVINGPPSSVGQGGSFSVTYQIENTGTNQGSFTVEIQKLPSGITVSDITGQVRSKNIDGTPPTASTANVPANGGTIKVTVEYNVSSTAATENQSLRFYVEQPIDGTTDTVTTSVQITKEGGDTNGTDDTDGTDNTEGTDDTASDKQNDERTKRSAQSVVEVTERTRFSIDRSIWRGQQLIFDASSILDPGLPKPQRTFEIRRIRGRNDNSLGRTVREFVVHPTNRTATISTLSLNGSYVITHAATGYLIGVRNGTASLGPLYDTTGYVWTVRSHTLRTTVGDGQSTVPTHGSVTISLQSNRNERYLLNISAESLSPDALTTIWGNSQDIVAVDENAGRITVAVSPETGLTANFTEYDDIGRYTFTFDVVDSTATTTVDIFVTERDTTMEFVSAPIVEQEGDIASIPISMDRGNIGWLFAYQPATGFLERVKLVDDGDGRVTIEMNLYTARGIFGSTYTTSDADDRIAAVTDSTSSRFRHRRVSSPHHPNSSLVPLQQGNYQLVGSASPNVTIGNTSRITIPHTRGRATLAIRDRATMDIQTLIAPMGPADTPVGVRQLTTPSADSAAVQQSVADHIALGDRLIIRVRASGVFGYLDNATVPTAGGIGQTVPTPAGNDSVGLELRIAPSGPSPSTNAAIDLSQNHSFLYTDPQNDTFTVVIDTSVVDPAIVPNETYDVTFAIYGPANDSGPYRGSKARANLGAPAPATYPGFPNPYLPENGVERTTTSIRLVTPSVTFPDQTADRSVTLPASRRAILTGRTTVAPGSELTVRLYSTTPSPFSRTRNTTVEANGSISVPFNLTALPSNYSFTITVRYNDTIIASRQGRIVVNSTRPALTSSSAGQPGFGIPAAILAVLSITGLFVFGLRWRW